MVGGIGFCKIHFVVQLVCFKDCESSHKTHSCIVFTLLSSFIFPLCTVQFHHPLICTSLNKHKKGLPLARPRVPGVKHRTQPCFAALNTKQPSFRELLVAVYGVMSSPPRIFKTNPRDCPPSSSQSPPSRLFCCSQAQQSATDDLKGDLLYHQVRV